MAEKNPTRTEILSIVQAQGETAQNLSERFVRIENLVEKQESRNQNALYAVLIAFVLIVVTVAAEVILSTKHDDSMYGGVYNEIIEVQKGVNDVQAKQSSLQTQLDILKVKNPYLK